MTQAVMVATVHRPGEAPADSMRRLVPVAAIALILLTPLLASIVVGGTTAVNIAGSVALIAAAMALGQRPSRRWWQGPTRQITGGLLVFFGIFVVAWQWQIGHLWLNSQILLYVSIALAFGAFIEWFRSSGESGARLVFEIKVGTVIGSSLLVLAAVWALPDDPGALWSLVFDPPVYDHIRHSNNDQLPAIALGICLLSLAESRGARLAWFAVLTAMGFLMAWSGGRGVMLSVGIFLTLVAAFRVLPARTVVIGCAALVLGAVLVLILGKADLFLRLFVTWSGSVNEVSSNRLDIWLASLEVWRESWLSVFFGFGPDAMRTTVRNEIGVLTIHQPHNAFIQVLIEFGILGLCVFVAAVGMIARRAMALLRSTRAPREARVAAALMFGFGAYMLNDGIIYHSIPFIMVMLLTAYLFSLHIEGASVPRVGRKGSEVSSQSIGSDR